MKRYILFFLLFIGATYLASAQKYENYFTDAACRVDFHFCGNENETEVFLDKIIRENEWGGRRNQLSTDINYGDFRFNILDSASNEIIYTSGFSALFHEWQSTPEATQINKSFEHTIQFPFPKKAILLSIEERVDFNEWNELFSGAINPTDKLIRNSVVANTPIKNLAKMTTPDKAIDIAIIAEGYSKKEMNKFYRDAKTLMDNLLSYEPFKSYKNRINFYAVGAVSSNSGISMPHQGDWKNTAVGSNFYTFYEPRYLTTQHNFKARDYASLVPYDAIYILANTTVYGGGGIYNMYALTAAGNSKSVVVTVHEFGHSFAGLGDEYFKENDDVLDGMYNTSIEPWEPNLTSLVQFEAKWKNMISPDTPIPTPISMKDSIKIGVFEGGGYLTKDMYRPSYDCRMRTNTAPAFCPVCTKAIERIILHLTETELDNN